MSLEFIGKDREIFDLISCGDYLKAEKECLKIISASENIDQASFFLGLCFIYKREYDSAIRVFKAISKKYDVPDVWNNLAHAYLGAGYVSDAIEHFKKALE